ncbi:thrombospondin type-1 domain-containing protein 4 [Engraulis encrasicolus]|uniref:thrombospondin type-1 domain-containing protein 4 n=1 Tax=Engraulis encrasicolus TaxID=184585 RepID=UPI002FD1A036
MWTPLPGCMRVSILLMLVSLRTLYCQQHSSDHHRRPEAHHDSPSQQGSAPAGSWGSWGPWAECSRSCGGGVQEQTRPCLPAHSHPVVPPHQPQHHHYPHHQPGNPPLVVSALRPSVPLYREGSQGRSPHANSSYTQAGDSDRTQPRVSRPSRRRGESSVVPGKYGYGRMPYVVSTQREPDSPSHPPAQSHPLHRQRRSPHTHGDGGSRTSTTRHTSRPHNPYYSHHQHQRQHHNPYHHHQHQAAVSQPRGASSWVPLHQPGTGTSTQQASTAEADARPYNPLPPSSCSGTPTQYKMCNPNPCPASSRSIREVQCSSYNSQPFMGRLYEWEPFNEVPGDQHCELNCRAIGFRFYVRQADRVIDGTPCGRNDTSICVAGKCQTMGCDEYLGSGRVMDKCGVCGGDNSACRLVSGLFQHSLSQVGYHKIVEIPLGATKINITEMVKSRNYLALRTRSGRSIINGNWAIDRPGKYEGVGTMFTYRRPNEISSTAGESFLAEGPTNEILDVFMIYQQPNPGVHYEFILPLDNNGGPHLPTDSSAEGNTVNGQSVTDHYGGSSHGQGSHGGGGYPSQGGSYPSQVPDNQVPQPQPQPQPPPRRQREYNWKLTGASDCSATCGKGSRYTVFSCVHRVSHAQVSEALCDRAAKPSIHEEPCNTEPCPAFWDIGEWSECSKTCGLGMQHRQVLCRQVYANRTLNVHTSRCRHLERPETTSTCQLKICSEWQIRSEWSPCSVPCGVGQRRREVHCLSNLGDIVSDEECNMNLRPADVENCDMGACAKSWFLTDWGSRCSAECGMGVRTRGVLCLSNHISSLPLEGCGSERPQETKVCNNGPCDSRIEWYTGPWSECSMDCGRGTQQRQVTCLMSSDGGFTVMPVYECSSLDKPLSQQSCQIKACGAKWYYTDWSACSKTCEGGFRIREVRCLSDDMLSTEGCEDHLRPPDREECNPGPCIPEIDENCRDKYFNCNVVVQARLCVYNYYRMACCASCSRVPHATTTHRSSGFRGRR